MARLKYTILLLFAFAYSHGSEIEDLEPEAPTKEALIIPKPFLKDVKLPLPFPPPLDKHRSPLDLKPLLPLDKHPLPLKPLGILNKKPIFPEDAKILGSEHEGPLNSFPLGHHSLEHDIPNDFSFHGPELHHDHSLHLAPKKPLVLPEPHLVTHFLNKHKEHINPLDAVAKKLPNPLSLKPHFPDHLVPEFFEPKPLKPLLPLPILPILESKLHHDHHPHLLSKKPLTLPEPLKPKLHHHHVLPKVPLPFPEPLKPNHPPLHSIPKKPFPLPELHLEKHLIEEHEKHIHPLEHPLFDGPKHLPEKPLPHLIGLKPHFPKPLVPEVVKPKPLGPLLPPPPPLEPKHHHHHPIGHIPPPPPPLDHHHHHPIGHIPPPPPPPLEHELHHHPLHLLPKKPLLLPKPHIGFDWNEEHGKPYEPKLVGHVLPPPVFLPQEPKLHKDHSLHDVPKKPLLVPEYEHEHEKPVHPIVPHIFVDSESVAEHDHDLKHFIPVPEVVVPLKPKVVFKHTSKPLGPKLHYDNSEAEKPLFVPESHLKRSLLKEQEASETIGTPKLSSTKSIPVYETTEEVEIIH